jgi:site-specific DNA recombinase
VNVSKRAGLYGRISESDDEQGVGRQIEDGHAFAVQHGIEVAGEYVDNDISAWQKRSKRPEFERLLQDLKAGAIDTIIVWKVDRLARRGRDIQRVIDLMEDHGVDLMSMTEPEFRGATGILLLRILSGFAEHESTVKSERVARKRKSEAEQGRFRAAGKRVFGYHRDGTPHPDEAPEYRKAVERILAGERPWSVLQDWRERGVLTTEGGVWRSANLYRLLRYPRHAGIVVYKGLQIDAEASWEALVPRDTWDRLQAVLDAHARSQSKPVRKHQLTGLLWCSRCGHRMNGRTLPGWAEYHCDGGSGGCNGVGIRSHRIEPEVVESVLHVLESQAFQDAQRAHALEDHGTNAAMAQLQDDKAALDQLTTDHYVDRLIDRQAFLGAKEQLDARIKATARKLAKKSNLLVQLPQDGDALRCWWEAARPEQRRTVLGLVIERIEVLPGGRWDAVSDRVRITWKV